MRKNTLILDRDKDKSAEIINNYEQIFKAEVQIK